jgi:hypothetical protein
MERKELDNIVKRFNELKSDRSQYTNLWNDIGKYVNIYTQDFSNVNQTSNGRQLDIELNDSTAMVAATQSAESIFGIIWGSGENVFALRPSDDLLEEIGDDIEVKDWYRYATDKSLGEMNHHMANFSGAKREEVYEKVTIGTGAVGAFINEDFERGSADNALEFKSYTVKAIAIDEGRNGMVDTVYVQYRWRINRIIKTFCTEDGQISEENLAKMPEKWVEAWNSGNSNQEFDLVCCVMPQDNYKKGVIGKFGAKYIAVWFSENPNQDFAIEYHKKMPIITGRGIKLAGETYGRGFATASIGTIKSLNYVMGDTLEAIEKMVKPPLGVFKSGLMGDDVIDTSSNSVTVVNGDKTGGQNPIFSLSDVKDVSGTINFLFPYMKDQISDSFKTDALMDFNSAKEMTATESLQRMRIRANVLRGILTQEKNESLIPLIDRSISLLLQLGILGLKPTDDPKLLEARREVSPQSIIPDVVARYMSEGKSWYKIEFTNELAKLSKTEQMDGINQMLMILQFLSGMDQTIVMGTDNYKILDMVNEIMNNDPKLLIGDKKFQERVAEMQKQQQVAAGLEAAESMANTKKTQAGAVKDERQSQTGT